MYKGIKGESYLRLGLGAVLHVGHNLLERILHLLRAISATIVKVDDVIPVLHDLLGNQWHVDGEAVASGSLPSSLTAPTAADLVKTASRVGTLVAAESENKRSNVVGLEGLDHLLGHDGGGHGSSGVGGDGVDVDAILEAFKSKRSGEAKNTTFL